MTSMTATVSRNAIAIAQLKLACRHVEEMMAAGVTENLAIRTLELFADVYAKMHNGGTASPHHVGDVKLWSIEAQRLRNRMPNAKPRSHFRVEHGTPRRAFARAVLSLFQKNDLSRKTMSELIEREYKLAVITLKQDRHLNKVARSKRFDTPEERWAAAGIEF